MKMKQQPRKGIQKDDSLFGLLSLNKYNNTYIRILVSQSKSSLVLQMTDNPKNWTNIPGEKYAEYRILRRLELGVAKISIKYLTPQNLLSVMGPLLGIRIPQAKVVIINNLSGAGYYILETSLKYKDKMLQGVRKIFNLSPQKRYEILEKSLAKSQD